MDQIRKMSATQLIESGGRKSIIAWLEERHANRIQKEFKKMRKELGERDKKIKKLEKKLRSKGS